MVDPSLSDDAIRAFLFESADGAYLGVSRDSAGANLPDHGEQQWIMKTEFALSVHGAVPENIDPEPILRGLKADGFFVWRTNRTRPFGTTQ